MGAFRVSWLAAVAYLRLRRSRAVGQVAEYAGDVVGSSWLDSEQGRTML